MDVAGYDLAIRCVAERHLGGDFFDWFFLDGGFQVVLADVMGKGSAQEQVRMVLGLFNLDRVLRPYADVSDATDGW